MEKVSAMQVQHQQHVIIGSVAGGVVFSVLVGVGLVCR